MSGLNITFQLGALPEAFSGTPQEFADLIVARLSAVVSGSFMTGQIGGVEPTSDIGLYVDEDNRVIKVWSETDGEYVKTQSDLPVGSCVMWMADIAPEGWLICNGQLLQRDDYPKLFSVLGTRWGDSGSGTDFRLPKTQGRTSFGIGQCEHADYIGSGRTDKGKLIEGGVAGIGGFDFVNFVPTEWSNPDKSTVIRAWTLGLGYAYTYFSDTIPPYFGVHYIIKTE